MKIFTSEQIKACDAVTIRDEGITSTDLMERAARKCYEWIAAHYKSPTPILVVCGMGNNGGDGLALTRILLQEGFSARAVVLKYNEQFTPDTAHHLTLLHQLASEMIQILDEGMFVTALPEDILIIDALIGTGLNRPVEGWLAAFIQELNELDNEKVSIDMPSGLPADSLPDRKAAVVRATHTLSFQFYKRSFFHAEAAGATGQVHILDIGLSSRYIESTFTQYGTVDAEGIRAYYKPRDRFGHKGVFGKALLIGGSYGKIGAVSLSTGAALRAGAGLVFTEAPECGYAVLQTVHPEAMYIASGKDFTERISIEPGCTVGIGPGLGQHPDTIKVFLNFLEQWKEPLVLDADALNIIAQHESVLHLIPPGSILTPHPKEFERLFGPAKDSMLRVETARAKAMKYNIYIVLKGHHTAILCPSGACWYNTTGNAGMATGGSGDVLTGILTGLLAQGYNSLNAALLGVYLHGLSGDLAAQELSRESLTAGDLIRYLGKAFLQLQKK